MRYYDHFWKPLVKPITILNRVTGQEIDGVIVRDQYYGELINWARGSGPIVPMTRLYKDGGCEWAVQKRRSEYNNKYSLRRYHQKKRERIAALIENYVVIFLCGLLLGANGCVMYPGGHLAGAFDQKAINQELARLDQEYMVYHKLMHGADK